VQQISMPFLEHFFFAEFISWPCDQVPLFSCHAVTKGPVLMLIHNESDTTPTKINQEVIIRKVDMLAVCLIKCGLTGQAGFRRKPL